MQKAEPGWGKTKENVQVLFMWAKLRPAYTQLRFYYAGLFGKDTEKLTDFNTSPFLPWDFYCAQTLLFFPLKDESRSMLDRLRWHKALPGNTDLESTVGFSESFLMSGTGE